MQARWSIGSRVVRLSSSEAAANQTLHPAAAASRVFGVFFLAGGVRGRHHREVFTEPLRHGAFGGYAWFFVHPSSRISSASPSPRQKFCTCRAVSRHYIVDDSSIREQEHGSRQTGWPSSLSSPHRRDAIHVGVERPGAIGQFRLGSGPIGLRPAHAPAQHACLGCLPAHAQS